MASITVTGMSCNHCRQSVTDAVSKVPGVASVEVDLQSGTATWTDKDPSSPASPEAVKQAVRAIGFGAE